MNNTSSKSSPDKPAFVRFFRLRNKLIVPYVVLTLLLAMVGTYVVTRLVTASLHERFTNQLFEASRVAADSVVRRERRHLEQLRLMAYSQGVGPAIQESDGEGLKEILSPLIINGQVEAVTVIDLKAQEVITLGYDADKNVYVHSQGRDFSDRRLVSRVLNGEVDERGDKYVEVLESAKGMVLFTSAPVYGPQGELAGVLLVGTRLSTLLTEIKSQALADVILLDFDNQLEASTLAPGDAELQELVQAIGTLSAKPTPDNPLIQNLKLYGRDFQVVYSPLLVRDQPVAVIGLALPSTYITSAEATSRNLFSLIFTIATALVIVTGYFLAQDIARPILHLRSLTQAVAEGNLEQEIGLERADEIGDLAHSFDRMTYQLRERTAETARLYAESIQRNKELAEINARLQSTQQQLIQSEKLAAVGQLTAGIVHDVKNPLAVIKGLSELLQTEDNLAEREELYIIRESAVKANQIVSDLLKFARQSTPQMKWQDMRETIETALRLTAFLIRKAQVQVVSDLPDQPVMVVYDAQQIEQVLLNLITNAIQAMPSGGSLHVHLNQSNDVIALAIQDSGTGIAEENLHRVFDPFFTTKAPGEGTGLGLSVSYGIIACHQGEIKVESSLGEGTTFTILLPVDPPSLKLRENAYELEKSTGS